MQFISTRGGMSPIGFTDVLLQGLAPDGGLTIPAETPRLTAEDLESLRPLPYAELAARIIGSAPTDRDVRDRMAEFQDRLRKTAKAKGTALRRKLEG